MSVFEKFLKRTVDILLTFGAFLFLWPLFLIISLAIKMDSPGPVLFKQQRVGRDGNLFDIFKFRTMVVGAEKKGLGYEIEKNDSRITKVGDFLRRWSLDELPQIFNVMRGEMSIVGPRPTLKYQVDQYDDFQRRRLEVKPGMTGLATVRGRNLLSWNERIEYDVWYVDNYSIGLDFKIMAETFRVVFTGEGVYTDDLNKFKVKSSQKTAETPPIPDKNNDKNAQ